MGLVFNPFTGNFDLTGAGGASGPVTFSSLTGKPTTLGGYGITDGQTSAQVQSAILTAIGALTAGSPAQLDTFLEVYNRFLSDEGTLMTLTTAVAGKEPAITAGTTGQYWRGDKTFAPLNPSAVGLGNVPNVDATNAGKTLVVDSVNGSDSTGARGRSALPFLTLSAAKAAANSGDTVRVLPGAYTTTTSLAKDGVNWHFEAGATVAMLTSADIGIWDDGGAAMVFTVTGKGEFTVTADDGDPSIKCVQSSHASSDISVVAKKIGINGALGIGGFAINGVAGRLTVVAEQILTVGDTDYAVWWINGEMSVYADLIDCSYIAITSIVVTAPTGHAYIRANRIRAEATVVRASGTNSVAAMWVDAILIEASTSVGLAVEGAGANRLYVRAQKLFGLVQTGSSTGLVYIDCFKHSAIKDGTTGNPNLLKTNGGTLRYSTKHLDPAGFGGETLRFGGGTAILGVGTFTGEATGLGWLVTGGTLQLGSSSIDTSANNATEPLTKSGGIVILEDCTLTAQSSRNSITAATAQTVQIVGALSTNRPVNVNVTLDYSQNNVAPVDGAAATASLRTIGTGATQAAAGNHTHTPASLGAEATANKGAANGYAPLGSDQRVPTANLPAFLAGALHYEGTWNATTNSPTITSGTAGTNQEVGSYYVVSTSGTTTVDGVSTWTAGDWIVFDGTKWDKLDGAANPVASVNGATGAVVIPSDAAAGTPSLRTLGTGAQQALPGNTTIPAASANVTGIRKSAGAGSTDTAAIAGTDYVAPNVATVGGTQTTSTPVLNLAQTWNAGAVTFTGAKLNITDTASAAGSLLLDLQVGGVSKFNADKAGVLTLAGGGKISSTPTGIGANAVYISKIGTDTFQTASVDDAGMTVGFGFLLGSSRRLIWSSTAAWYGTGDTGLSRISAGLVGVGNGAAGDFSGSLKLKQLLVDATLTAAGTTGAVTINKGAGSARIAAGGSSVVVTNSLSTTSTRIHAVVSTADATAYVRNVVPATGSFTITLGAAATAETEIRWDLLG